MCLPAICVSSLKVCYSPYPFVWEFGFVVFYLLGDCYSLGFLFLRYCLRFNCLSFPNAKIKSMCHGAQPSPFLITQVWDTSRRRRKTAYLPEYAHTSVFKGTPLCNKPGACPVFSFFEYCSTFENDPNTVPASSLQDKYFADLFSSPLPIFSFS